MHQAVLPCCEGNQESAILEEFITRVFPLEKELVSIRKEYTLEYLQLLNFFSARYGNYKVGKNRVHFTYGVENKLYESYLKNIQLLLQKEEAIALQLSQLMQNLRDRLDAARSSSSKMAISEQQ